MTQPTSTTKAPKARTKAAKITEVIEAPAAVAQSKLKGKLGAIVELLERPGGATIADLADATGWQDHSVRGALAGALKKRGVFAISEKIGGVRRYRLETGDTPQSLGRHG